MFPEGTDAEKDQLTENGLPLSNHKTNRDDNAPDLTK